MEYIKSSEDSKKCGCQGSEGDGSSSQDININTQGREG